MCMVATFVQNKTLKDNPEAYKNGIAVGGKGDQGSGHRNGRETPRHLFMWF